MTIDSSGKIQTLILPSLLQSATRVFVSWKCLRTLLRHTFVANLKKSGGGPLDIILKRRGRKGKRKWEKEKGNEPVNSRLWVHRPTHFLNKTRAVSVKLEITGLGSKSRNCNTSSPTVCPVSNFAVSEITLSESLRVRSDDLPSWVGYGQDSGVRVSVSFKCSYTCRIYSANIIRQLLSCSDSATRPSQWANARYDVMFEFDSPRSKIFIIFFLLFTAVLL